MEASLLPSEEIRNLSGKAILAAVRRGDPALKALRAEFGIAWPNLWVIVLDAKGETLAGFMGDSVGRGGCTQDAAAGFPARLAGRIEDGLGRLQSVQALERGWIGHPGDAAAFQALRDRLRDLDQLPRLSGVCERVLGDPQLPGEVRDAVRIEAFLLRAQDPRGCSDAACRNAFIEEGERLLIGIPRHPRSGEVVAALCRSGLTFDDGGDLPARVSAALARLDTAAGGAGDPLPLRERIQELSVLCGKGLAKSAFSRLLEEYVALVSDEDAEGEQALGERVLAAAGGDPGCLREMADTLLTEEEIEKRDPALALRAAEAACRVSRGDDAEVMNTYALALFESGKAAEALAAQKKALELCKENDGDVKVRYQGALEQYRKASAR